MSCTICLEPYDNLNCIPMLLNPCGHGVCQVCLNNWNNSSMPGRNTCPECRQSITNSSINRSLMDILSNSNLYPSLNSDNNQSSSDQNIFECNNNSFSNLSSQKRENEILHDKCDYSFIVIDNSLSMSHEDGKQFYLNENKEIIKFQYNTRWEEACCKIMQICDYNIQRKMITNYYLLNPYNLKDWVENQDYIIIDPNNENYTYQRDILKNNILSYQNIRYNTPLDKITIEFKKFLDSSYLSNKIICYNIITDGEPNNSQLFESQLNKLCKDYSIFIVINLCTDNERVVDYYNLLDTKLGNEISGLDVIDDFENELKEINLAGNNFFVYTFPIHVCRMAGCYSVIGDMLDEKKLPKAYINKFLKEIFKIKHHQLNINDLNNYLEEISKYNNNYENQYNFKTKKFEKIINMTKLGYILNNNFCILI